MKRKTLNQDGQSVVMVSMMILSFLSFFYFVVNTGVLITAKISLQTAADAAAYAGAAVQARQMNAISYLNYDMRRQLKKFIYRQSIVGTFARIKPGQGFANPAGTTTQNGFYNFAIKRFDPTDNNPFYFALNAPVICVPLTPAGGKDDSCIAANIPNTAVQLTSKIPAGGLSSLTNALLTQLTNIASTQQAVCEARGEFNKYIAMSWLFRGDTDPSAITNMFNASALPNPTGTPIPPAEKAKVETMLRTISEGIGLYPREIINLMRIETLEKFLNQAPEQDVDYDLSKSMERSPNAEFHERTVLAFRSALHNLNQNVFNHSDLHMVELQNQQQIKLKAIFRNFDVFYQVIDKAASTGTSSTSVCVINTEKFTVSGLPVGVIREDSPPLVHYAVKVKAKAKLLFLNAILPGGVLEMEAVAAAKPFGSRIGPPESDSDPNYFTTDLRECGMAQAPCKIPNLSISAAPQTASSVSMSFLNAINQQINPNGTAYTSQTLNLGMKIASAPNPSEVGLYNILPAPPKQGQEASMKYEYVPYWNPPPPNRPAGDSVYRFYAPVFPAGGSADPRSKIQTFLDQMFATVSVGNQSGQQYDVATLRAQIESQLLAYITKLSSAPSAPTENAESYVFAATELPIDRGIPSSTQRFWLTDSQDVLSSWGPNHTRIDDSRNGLKPRFGFSVKFVAFQSLQQQGMNLIDDDLDKVKH